MKINKKQWPVIANGINRIANLFSAVVESLQTLTLAVQHLARYDVGHLRENIHCTECLYYGSPIQTGKLLGECRYNPPIRDEELDDNGRHIQSAFPTVMPDQWCGRWRKP